MVNINKYIKALLDPAGGHQGSHKAHQAVYVYRGGVAVQWVGLGCGVRLCMRSYLRACMCVGFVPVIGIAIHTYHQTSNIRHTLVGSENIDPSDVVGASPMGAAPNTSSFWT